MRNLLRRFKGRQTTVGERPEPTPYQGFWLYPTPKKDPNGWRIAGEISRDGQGDTPYTFVRADTCPSRAEATRISLAKAQQLVDDYGAKLFPAPD